MSATMNIINNWLLNELRKRDWSQADLARRAGVSRTAISDIISGKRKIGRDLAVSISEAFKLPLEEVYRAAGLLPPEPAETKLARQITHITAQLPPEEQQGLLEFAKLRLRLSEKQGQYETRKPAKHTGSPK